MGSVREIGNGSKATLDDIYKYVVVEDFGRKTSKSSLNYQTPGPSINESANSSLKDSIYSGYNTIKDSALGIGAGISTVFRNTFPQVIAPRLQTIGASLSRVGGGLITLAGTAPAIYSAVKEDMAAGGTQFYNTRKELAASAGGITTAYAVGQVGAWGITALAALNAPAAVLIGASVLTMGAAGYGAYKAREFTEAYFDKIN